jgi:CMP-N,N'-diacetyllegionaminic acid synthase
MIGKKKVLAVIAARGGSKGLPGKNIALLGGKPVVAWSVAAAHCSKLIDRTILSSEDTEIIAAARGAGCDVPFVRPATLATDDASIADVILHALDALQEHYDYVVLLQATSPLRSAEDIDDCIRACESAGASSAVTLTQSDKNPRWMFMLGPKCVLKPMGSWDDLKSRRQEMAPVYAANGAVYVVRVDRFQLSHNFFDPDSVGCVMPRERSVDIDEAIDLTLAKALLERNR